MIDEKRTHGAWLFDIAAGLSLAGALVYATGWTYAFHYFDRFGLGLLELGIPHHYFLMYGFWVFKAWWWLWVLLYAIAMVLLLGLHGWSRREGWIGILAKQAQVALVLLAFALGGWLAREQAGDYYAAQQAQGFSAFPHVRVWPKDVKAEDESLRAFYAALPQGAYRLLLHGKQRIYLIKPPHDGLPVRLAVSELPLAHIESLRVLP